MSEGILSVSRRLSQQAWHFQKLFCLHVQQRRCSRYKTIIITVLTVISGMDPHMISGNLGWVFVKSWLGCVEVGFIRLRVGHGETP
jgi:hypothetical protein